jgi:hypothetical protein
MKKIVLLLFSISVLSAKGQSYIPLLGDTTEWNIAWNVNAVIHERNFVIMDGDYKAYGDTIINGLNYKFFNPPLTSGYLREDTSLQQVWFLQDTASQELLLYDFSLNQNDSILLTFPNYISGDPFPTGWYYVDSIISRNIMAGPRKFYYLSNPASPINWMDNGINRFYLVWMEGVGSNVHPLYIYLQENGQPQGGPFTWPCGAYFSLALTCAYKNNVQQFFDTCFWNNYSMYATDSCHYSFPGGINESGNFSSIILSPNPTTNELKIENGELKIKEIEIYNCLGEKVFQERLTSNVQRLTINVADCPPGIYFVKLTGDKTNLTGKFVKE